MRLVSETGEQQWLKFSTYATQLKPDDRDKVIWPKEQDGQKMYAHLIQTWARKLGSTVALITCHNPNQSLKSIHYWGITLFTLRAQDLANILAIRRYIETFFEYYKDLLDGDHCQLMTTQAIIRFWTLIAYLLYFLEEQRALRDLPCFTCGATRR